MRVLNPIPQNARLVDLIAGPTSTMLEGTLQLARALENEFVFVRPGHFARGAAR